MGIISAKWNSASQVETLNEALKNAEDVRDEAIRHGVLHLATIAKLEKQIAAAMRENAELRELLALLTKTIIVS